MATGSDTALHCFSDTGRANESKAEREAERQYKKERGRCCDAITLALDRVMSWPMVWISVGDCVTLQSNYTSLQRQRQKSRQQRRVRHGNTNRDAPKQPAVLCSRSVAYTLTPKWPIQSFFSLKSTLIWSWGFFWSIPEHPVFLTTVTSVDLAMQLGLLVIWFWNIPGTASMSSLVQNPKNPTWYGVCPISLFLFTLKCCSSRLRQSKMFSLQSGYWNNRAI